MLHEAKEILINYIFCSLYDETSIKKKKVKTLTDNPNV